MMDLGWLVDVAQLQVDLDSVAMKLDPQQLQHLQQMALRQL
jgi:hypothetical protein